MGALRSENIINLVVRLLDFLKKCSNGFLLGHFILFQLTAFGESFDGEHVRAGRLVVDGCLVRRAVPALFLLLLIFAVAFALGHSLVIRYVEVLGHSNPRRQLFKHFLVNQHHLRERLLHFCARRSRGRAARLVRPNGEVAERGSFVCQLACGHHVKDTRSTERGHVVYCHEYLESG